MDWMLNWPVNNPVNEYFVVEGHSVFPHLNWGNIYFYWHKHWWYIFIKPCRWKSFYFPSLLKHWTWCTLLASNWGPIVSSGEPVVSAEMPDWIRAWFGSQKYWGGAWCLWRRVHTCDFSLTKFRRKSYEKNMKPTLSVSTKPLKYCWHVFSSKAKGEKKNKYRNKKGSWQGDSSLWWVSAFFSLCMKLDQFTETAGGCVISNIGYAPN